MADRGVLELRLGDVVRLRKRHPCGGQEWLIDRLGADIGLRCQGCGRHVLIERRTLEGRIAAFVSRGDEALTAALRPHGRDAASREPGPESTPGSPMSRVGRSPGDATA